MSVFPRALMLAACAAAASYALVVNINFQPDMSPVPLGYVKDVGAPWSDAAGRGWVTEASLSSSTHVPVDQSAWTRDRARSGIDSKLNTILHMQPSTGTAAAYEYALANGTYTVTVSVGDQPTYNSTNRINIEGVNVINNFTGSATTEFKTWTGSVTVADGKLTVDAKGGTNTKINYLRIVQGTEPANINLKINFGKSSGTLPSGYLRDYGQAYAKRTASDQGAGKWTYGWVKPGTSTALDLSSKGLDRNTPSDRRLATLMQMQSTAGSWEIAVPNNWYTVTLSCGDASDITNKHMVWIEPPTTQTSTSAINFTPSATNKFFTVTQVVQVKDGKLTLAAIQPFTKQMGTKTKINYVTIQSGVTSSGRPSVSLITPKAFATGVNLDAPVTAEVKLPNGPLNEKTLTSSTVRLYKSNDNSVVSAVVNTSGGGDVIVLQPSQPLAANTGYRIEISQSVQDATGKPFAPFSSAFTTGTTMSEPRTAEVFEKVSLGADAAGRTFTSVVIGPDHKLYAATITGEICRYAINVDGTLGAVQVINSVRAAEGNVDRAVIGLTFDPAATASDLVLWITNNGGVLQNAPDWAGKLTRLSGPDLATVKDYVVHFPRSAKDHMTNSIAFNPDDYDPVTGAPLPGRAHVLYLTQGSMSAMGAPDNAWSNRDEHLLNAAVLRVDIDALEAGPLPLPLDIQTEVPAPAAPYDPYAPGAPVTLYATGVRNAYDILWHDGHLFTATNSSAANGNMPSTPPDFATQPACVDRGYTGPAVTGVTTVDNAPPDYLYRIEPGLYYGHPNPKRCEWVMNGGNPSSGVDPDEQHQYPVGTMPDVKYTGYRHALGLHFSPDGMMIYGSDAFGGTLRDRLMIVRYSVGDDILVLTLTGGDVTDTKVLNMGTATLSDPLDIALDAPTGNIYVTEYAGKAISLLRPKP